jgi:hypothetical protein
MANADIYLTTMGGAMMPPKTQAPTTTTLGAVAGQLAQVSSGAAVIFDWEESGEPPVPAEISEARAAVCVTCDRNDQGDWTRFFTKPIAAMIRKRMEMVHQRNLSTPHDAKLQVCLACSCPLREKVHVPIRHIRKHITDETKKVLPSWCWMELEGK